MAQTGYAQKKAVFPLAALALFASLDAWGWGELAHRIAAENSARLAGVETLAGCHFTEAELVSHVNDPDSKWRGQRILHPHEGTAHFFHVDRQPKDWRRRTEAADRRQGFLVYRIVDWTAEAKKLRAAGKWDALKEHLYGISHYLGDLTQPMHVHHDYDGVEAGVSGIHLQFESKMLNRFEDRLRAQVAARLTREKIPVLWKDLPLRELIFNVAEQSFAKTASLFQRSKSALVYQKSKKKKSEARSRTPRFVKEKLWDATGDVAADQLALASRLIAHVLGLICR